MSISRRRFLAGCATSTLALRQAQADEEILLDARPAFGAIAGIQTQYWGYNGAMPGPVIEARAGDTIRIRFRNSLPETTNLHFHGLHVSPTGHGDNPFLEVPTGEELLYEAPLPSTHPPGTFWYHPHVHGSTARQVFRGLSGPLLVRGELDEIPEVAQATEHILMLKDFTIARNGVIPEASFGQRMQGREGSLLTINGALRPQFSIARNGLLRLRVVNASSSRYYRFEVEDHPLAIIATDGGPLPSTRWAEDYLLAPGQRIDALLAGDRPPGAYRILNLPYNRGAMMMGATATPPTEVLGHLIYSDTTAQAIPVPDRLVSATTLPAPNFQRNFVLTEGMMGSFLINGRSFDMNRIDTHVQLGTVEDWVIENRGGMDHPFHVHVNPFQLVDSAGIIDPAWRDVINVPRQSSRRIRIAFNDYPGMTVYHCHILDHEDMGMMGILEMS
ncbi:MAG: multicopper oxidase family protein [Acidobacteria bacterium]|nr:multicopper oxidase family protein [Acidobacteriota bacterium]